MSSHPHSEGIDPAQYVEYRLFGDRPHLRGRKLPLITIVWNQRDHGWSIAETAQYFNIPKEEVDAALRYYDQHQADIDQLETEELVHVGMLTRRGGPFTAAHVEASLARMTAAQPLQRPAPTRWQRWKYALDDLRLAFKRWREDNL